MSNAPSMGVSRRSSRGLPWYVAVPLAGIGGLALDAATPGLEWWSAGLIGAALVTAAVWQQRALMGLLVGVIAGGLFWLPHISWLTLYLGPIPWLGLAAVMIAWFGLFGMFAAIATRGFARLIRPAWVAILAQSIAVAGLWVAREQLQVTWPYGGFAWGRLAHTQAESPLSALVSWLGFAGLSGLLAFVSAVLAISFLRAMRGARVWALPLLTVIALVLLMLVPPFGLEQSGFLRVAAVQGNSKSGIFDDRENGDVIRDHLETTEAFLDRLDAQGESVDLIVWPENSAEFQLPDQHSRDFAVRSLARRAGAPIVVGTILQDPDGTFTNSSLVYDGDGATDLRYDKRRPVPFAEYMPSRSFFRMLVPELVDLVQLEYEFGERSAVLPIETAAGTVRAGVAICFDIIWDDHAAAMSADGLEVILAPTNNADFGRTDQSAQQLQIARLRAIEMGRSLVNISTVGTSAIVLPGGHDADQLTPFTADVMMAEIPLYTGETPASRAGGVFAAIWVILGIGGFAVGLATLARSRERF